MSRHRYWLRGFGEDEKLVIEYEIPDRLWSMMRQMAGMKPEDDGMGEYEVTLPDARQLVDLLGFDIHPDCKWWSVGPRE